VIYFLQSSSGGPIKIGYSQDVETRIGQLEADFGRPLALLRVMPGGRDEEKAIHGRFAHLRLGQTEQFRPASDLMDFIGRPLLVGANPDTVEVMGVDRVTIVNLKGSMEQREWLDHIARETMIPASRIVRAALSAWAKKRGYPPMPGMEDH
jgi:hypothetical protein